MALMAVSTIRVPKSKAPQPPKVQLRPIPIHVILGRLDEICKEEGQWAKAGLYMAELGTMLEFRAVTSLLTDGQLLELEKVRKLVSGTLFVGPVMVKGQAHNGAETRLQRVEVTIRTNCPVEVIPIQKQPS